MHTFAKTIFSYEPRGYKSMPALYKITENPLLVQVKKFSLCLFFDLMERLINILGRPHSIRQCWYRHSIVHTYFWWTEIFTSSGGYPRTWDQSTIRMPFAWTLKKTYEVKRNISWTLHFAHVQREEVEGQPEHDVSRLFHAISHQ